jgi:metallo-beta-lactamase class B
MKTLFPLLFLILIQVQAYPREKIRISDDLELIRISDNAWIHVSWTTLPEYGRISANGLIYADNGKAFLFDTPWNDSLTCELLTYLKDRMNISVIGVVPNHWHSDCMGGLGYLKSRNTASYANQMTIDIAVSKNLPCPDRGFSDSLQLALGNKSVMCYYFGAAHSADNIVVWLPEEKILFPGCMVKSSGSHDLGFLGDGNLAEYPGTIGKVLKKFPSARIVIPGHGPAGGYELILHTAELLNLK